MRLYVATAYANREEAQRVIAVLTARGHTITHDWTTQTLDGVPPAEHRAFLDRCGRHDFAGVVSADAVVLLADARMRDARIEMGIALGVGIPVFVLDPTGVLATSVFLNLPGIRRVASLAEVP